MKIIFVIGLFLVSLSAQAQLSRAADVFLSLSDIELFNLGLKWKVGKCYVADHRGNGNYCDFYVQSSKSGLASVGLPHGYGTGCLVAPTFPKGVGTCWGSPNVYDQYNNSTTPICTSDYVKNAVNMLRIGIKRGICDVDSSVVVVPSATPTPLPTPFNIAPSVPLVPLCDAKKFSALEVELKRVAFVSESNYKLSEDFKKQVVVLQTQLTVCHSDKLKLVDSSKKEVDDYKKLIDEQKKIIAAITKERDEHKKKCDDGIKNLNSITKQRDDNKKLFDDQKKLAATISKERDTHKRLADDRSKSISSLLKQVSDLQIHLLIKKR